MKLLLWIVCGVILQTLQPDFAAMRNEMVQQQMIERGISDPKVLEAMQKVERHLFVPEQYQAKAYNDYPLPIGHDQTISQPYIVAYMTEKLELDGSEKVLEIGTGSGYQAAVLAEICKEVFTIEVIEELGKQAAETFKRAGYSNIHTKVGDGYKGWPSEAPFDAIIVTAAPTHIPYALKEQLAEGGKMIIPVGKEGGIQHLYLMEKRQGAIKQKSVLSVRFVPLKNEAGKSY